MTEYTIMISSGSGPKECEFAASGIAKAYLREAKASGVSGIILEGGSAGSCLMRLSGENAKAFLTQRIGSVKWICQSPFRKNHKRKNWFVGVSILPEPEAVPMLDVKDITFTAMRASGPGGQHVNKTNSAVRAVHAPTGLAVTAQEERSQHANKKLCLVKLAAILSAEDERREADNEKSAWRNHKSLERGNPVRTYHGMNFKFSG